MAPEDILRFGAFALATAVMVAFGSAFALVLWWNRRQLLRRNAMLQALAERLGFKFVEAVPSTRRAGITLFDRPPQVFLRYHLRGPAPLRRSAHMESVSADPRLCLGEVLDTTRMVSEDITLATADDATLDLPIFCVEPWPRHPSLWFAMHGLEPIAMPEDPAFNERFSVRGPDAAAVRRVLDETIRRELTRQSYTLEGHGQTLMLFREGSMPHTPLDSAQCERLLEDLKAIAALDWGRERQ